MCCIADLAPIYRYCPPGPVGAQGVVVILSLPGFAAPQAYLASYDTAVFIE